MREAAGRALRQANETQHVRHQSTSRGIVLGAGLIAYRFYARPTTLSIAVGSFDGEAARMATIIAARLDATKSSVRLKIVPTDNVLDSAKAFAAGKTDLAIMRADVGDLSNARSVVLVSKSVLMILATIAWSFVGSQ